jgi:hypothetical protein
MSVSDQDAIQAFEPGAGLQNLPLGTLAAVDQKTIFVVFDNLGRETAPGGWGRGGGAQEDDFEQSAVSFV